MRTSGFIKVIKQNAHPIEFKKTNIASYQTHSEEDCESYSMMFRKLSMKMLNFKTYKTTD